MWHRKVPRCHLNQLSLVNTFRYPERAFVFEESIVVVRAMSPKVVIPSTVGSSLSAFPLLIGISLLLVVFQLWRTWWRLRHIPGPFPASITNFQRVRWVTTKRAHLKLQGMHEKYGEVVRIGPNTVVFSNPEAIPTVYTARTGFPKVRVLAAILLL